MKAVTPPPPPPHTHTPDELIQAIRNDIATAREKLEEPDMRQLALKLADQFRKQPEFD